nr:HYD1 signature containing ADP-ribosyltransferase family protein [Flavobacterium columnare]
MYGGLRNFSSPINLTPDFIPFRQLGQYEDPELEGLYYNRFRYYDCGIGNYISQDPIGLAGNNPTFYGYVADSNSWVDVTGLAGFEPSVSLGTAPKGTTLYHYTNQKGLNGILESKEIWPSLKANNPKDARFGDGHYLSDIKPGTKSPKELALSFVRVPNQHKFTHFVEIDVSGLEIHQGVNRKDVFIIFGNQNLDISNRIVSSGKVECG